MGYGYGYGTWSHEPIVNKVTLPAMQCKASFLQFQIQQSPLALIVVLRSSFPSSPSSSLPLPSPSSPPLLHPLILIYSPILPSSLPLTSPFILSLPLTSPFIPSLLLLFSSSLLLSSPHTKADEDEMRRAEADEADMIRSVG